MPAGTRRARFGLAALAAIACAALLPAAADAATIVVHPGPGAIGKALDQASAGDTIRIHHGRYPEQLTITKRVRIVAAAHERRPVVGPPCNQALDAIAVRHNGVVLRGLKVVGGDGDFNPSPAEVDFHYVDTGRVANMVLIDSCGAEYGVNVYRSGAIQIVNSRARGFDDAGFYVGTIVDTNGDPLRVRNNESHGNNRGVIVEDSDATIPAIDIRVTQNNTHDNFIPPGEGSPSGIFLHNSDGVLISGNTADDNGDASEGYGIHLDANSDSNTLTGNSAHGNLTFDLFNEGLNNCGAGNSFGTASGSLVPC